MQAFGRRAVYVLLAVLCGTAAVFARSPADPDYDDYYAKGITFAAFLDQAQARRDEWLAHYNDAAVTADMMTRMRALPERRRLLVVAEDWCGDSVNTIPFLARLVDAAPERLAMRVINSKAGRPVMEAHLTPDGRAATPTVVVLAEDGRVVGAFTERPSALRAWVEQQKADRQNPPSQQALHDRIMTWYTDDAGKATVADIAELLAR
jgi:hypothetical protein